MDRNTQNVTFKENSFPLKETAAMQENRKNTTVTGEKYHGK